MSSLLDDKAKEFVEKVRAKFKPEKIILFGSRARGDWLNESDYDFIIVSKKFEGTDFIGRATRVLRECYSGIGPDLLCYTPEEFKRKTKQISIVASAAREGVAL